MSDARTVLAEWQQRTDAAGEWEAYFTGEAYTLRFQRPFPKYRAADGRVEYVNVESGGLALSILTAREAMPKLLAAVEAVRALHVLEYDDASERNRCRECGYEDWTDPACPTVRAISDAIGRR